MGNAPDPRRRAARVVAVCLCLVLGWHFFATYTWSSASVAARDLIGRATLQSYMVPMFAQSWSVFAPNPASVNQNLLVRARVPDGDGGVKETSWVSLTDHSARTGILHHPVPSRLYLNDFLLANRYYAAAMAIDEPTRDVTGGAYLGDDWPTALRRDFLASLGTESSTKVDDFLQYERAVVGLASAVARARWDRATQVQVRVEKTPIVPFARRFDENASTTTDWFMDGWRPLAVPGGLDPAVFERWYGGDDAR